MSRRDIVVIGGSAGSIEPLRDLLASLPGSLAASVLVVIHRHGSSPTDSLINLLHRATTLAVAQAIDGEAPQPASVYLAPPQQHLRIVDGVMRTAEELEGPPNRIGVDVLFRSAAEQYRDRVIGVVLSGALNDGTAGLWEIRKMGGITIAQAPHLAEHPSMPASAMQEVPLHHCVGIKEIAATITGLVGTMPPALERARIMIVEDEHAVAMTIEHRLADLGYDVVASVASGTDALSAAMATRPDVVIMNLELAGPVTGTEAGRVLWTQLRLPIIYLTTYCDEQTLDEATAANPCGYLVKPFRAPQLHAAIRIALARGA